MFHNVSVKRLSCVVAGVAIMVSSAATVSPARAITPWPAARLGAAMAYDAAARVAVLFGGAGIVHRNDTWVWDGTTWKHKAAATTAPPPRSEATTAPDGSSSMVLFGGVDEDGLFLGDTWTWAGKPRGWVQQTPPVSPPPRAGAAMAPDGRGNVVLFGGEGARVLSRQVNLSDTWVWDGAAKTWAQQTPSVSPPDLARAAMAYDKASGKVVLFGGVRHVNGFLRTSDETWTWDPDTRDWKKEAPSTSPSSRRSHAMAYDGASRKVVLFGGFGTARLGDTWTWDGVEKRWTEHLPAAAPSSRQTHSMAYHAPTKRVVLFGGSSDSGLQDDTWAWNGLTLNWKRRGPS